MRERIDLGFCYHVNHILYAALPLLDVQLKRLIQLLTLLVVLCCLAPLGFALVILGDLQVLVDVSLVGLENDIRILIHLLVRLCYHKGILTLASQHEELYGFLLRSLLLTVGCNHQGALR